MNKLSLFRTLLSNKLLLNRLSSSETRFANLFDASKFFCPLLGKESGAFDGRVSYSVFFMFQMLMSQLCIDIWLNISI